MMEMFYAWYPDRGETQADIIPFTSYDEQTAAEEYAERCADPQRVNNLVRSMVVIVTDPSYEVTEGAGAIGRFLPYSEELDQRVQDVHAMRK